MVEKKKTRHQQSYQDSSSEDHERLYKINLAKSFEDISILTKGAPNIQCFLRIHMPKSWGT